jgi:hypothetical protein
VDAKSLNSLLGTAEGPRKPSKNRRIPDPLKSKNEEDRGRLSSIAASILMSLLYTARMARYDLLRPVCRLACYLSCWSIECDRRLFRLICYVQHSLDMFMVGWIGDDARTLSPHLYCDADFAGCSETQRSTSGVHLALEGLHTRFPLAGVSKRQGCVSTSTPEAEIVAGNFGFRSVLIPQLNLWDVLFRRTVQGYFWDDNKAMIQVCRTGKNPTMKWLSRTHRVSVASLHEMLGNPASKLDVTLGYRNTNYMSADIYTKAFSQEDKWLHAAKLINHFRLPPGDQNALCSHVQFYGDPLDPKLGLKHNEKTSADTAEA